MKLEFFILGIRYKFYLLVRKALCKLNIHDYETDYTAPDYAMLYCFYCEKSRKSYALPITKEEAKAAYEKWLERQ